MFTDQQIDDLLRVIDRDVARCNRWLNARHVSTNERIECRRLLQQWSELRVTLRGMRSRVRR